MNTSNRFILIGFFGCFLTAVLYVPILKAGFVYDDLWYLVRNPAVRTLNVISFFRDPQTAAAPGSGLSGDVYRPLGTLAFALAFKAWGLRSGPTHLASLLLHLLNGVLFWKVLEKLLKNSSAALVGAAVFLLHPAQVQSVAWISQLSSLIGGAGFLLALIFFLDDQELSGGQCLAGWLAFTAAVLSKETTVVLPFILWMFWDRRSLRQRRYGLGLLLIAAAYLVGRQAALRHLSEFPEGMASYADSLKLGLLAFPVYLGKIIFPISLRVSYGYPAYFSLWTPAAAGVVLLYAAVMVRLRRHPIPFRAMGWMVIGLLPVLQIVPIRAFVGERFLYIPLMGAGLLAGWLWKTHGRVKPLLLIWLVYLAARTAMAVPAWRSEQTLWAEAVRQEPSNAFAHACYAESLGDEPAAETEYFKVLVNQPSEGIRYAAFKNLAYLNHHWGRAWKANYWRKKAQTEKIGN